MLTTSGVSVGVGVGVTVLVAVGVIVGDGVLVGVIVAVLVAVGKGVGVSNGVGWIACAVLVGVAIGDTGGAGLAIQPYAIIKTVANEMRTKATIISVVPLSGFTPSTPIVLPSSGRSRCRSSRAG